MEEKDILKELERLKKEIEGLKKSGKPVEIPTPYPYYPYYPVYPPYDGCHPCSNPCRDCINCPYKTTYSPWQPNVTWKYEYRCTGDTVKYNSF